jgi:glycosyltransferase involved in cell wall biosynthesis
MTLHEYWLICPSHVLFRNGEEICTQRTCHSCTIRRGRPPQLWRQNGVIRDGLENIDLFLAPSRFVQDKVREFLPELPMKVLPHFLGSARAGQMEREDYYLIVARLEKAKGIHTVLPLFRKNGLRLKIAGAGEAEQELRSMAAGAPNIEFLGRVPFAELPSLYRRARATIVPSVCDETFGLVVLESLQQQTSVYVSPHGALPELVAQTGGGRVFRSAEELGGMLGGEQPVSADLTAFAPQTHMNRYLSLIRSMSRGKAVTV